jgi:hypothetical protein
MARSRSICAQAHGPITSGGRGRDGEPFGTGGWGIFRRPLFDQYLRGHRNAAELIKRGESKTLEFKSTLRWSLKENRKDDKGVTHAVLKTVAAFLNTEGGDLLIGVADDGSVVGIEHDQLDNDDKFPKQIPTPTSPNTPQETSGQRSPDSQSNTLNQKSNAPEEPIAGEGAKRSWWHSLWERLWGR